MLTIVSNSPNFQYRYPSKNVEPDLVSVSDDTKMWESENPQYNGMDSTQSAMGYGGSTSNHSEFASDLIRLNKMLKEMQTMVFELAEKMKQQGIA